MGDLPRLSVGGTSGPARRAPGGAVSAVFGMAGALVSFAALALGAVLAIVFAATLAFGMVLASVLLALAGLAWRLRMRTAPRDAVARGSSSGHAWVAYDWNRPLR